MIFTQNQIRELLDIIARYQITFIAKNIGADYLTTAERSILKSAGIKAEDIDKSKDVVDMAFKFGILSDALGDSRTKELAYKDFKKFIKSGKFVPLNQDEKAAIEFVKQQLTSDVRVLGGRINQDVSNILINEQRIVQEEAVKAIKNRDSVKKMALEIGHKTGNWGRDFDRISEFVLHKAYSEGRASGIERKDGDDAKVYIDVFPGACSHCVKNYLTSGMGSRPIVFKLSELRANGTNVGRKQANWKPVIPPLHPFCRCQITHYKEGTVWDETKNRFVYPKDFERKVKRTSKVNIQVGNKKFSV